MLFIGAGLGSHYTRPDGNKAPDSSILVNDLIRHFDLNIDPTDLARVAQIVEIRHGRSELDAFLKKSFKDLFPDQHIRWLTTFRWRAIYTTNYDMGIERAYELNAHPLQNPVPISATANMVQADSRVQVPIIHLHGTPFEPCPSHMVITQSDYTRYQDQRKMVWERLKLDFATSTILYLGYSGRDPNWQMVIEEVAREFAPSKPPTSYKLDPRFDPVDAEIFKETRRVETMALTLTDFCALVDQEIGDYRPLTDEANKYKDKVPPHLREDFEKNPAAMLRLLDSWAYINNEPTNLEPNTKEFLLGSRPNWSLISQGHRFVRDIEDDLWEWALDFITDEKAKTTSVLVTGPAGYGITTILMALALRIVDSRRGPVFMLKEGAEVSEGDIAYAATLFPTVPCYFLIDPAGEQANNVKAAIVQQRKTTSNCLFILGERRNEWLSANVVLPGETFDVEPLSDGEINRLLDFLDVENALGELKELDRSFQFNIVKKKHEQQLLVAMREATAGEGVGFDAIIESEFRGVDQGREASVARQFYLLVSCFYQHGMLIRDRVCESVLGLSLQDLYKDVGNALEGIIDVSEMRFARGEYAVRARHRIIAEIVWKKCGSQELKEHLLQLAMEKLNFTFRLDKNAFDFFIRSDEVVDTFRSLEGKTKFFETAARLDPDNVFVLQHYARMLLRERRLTAALNQIDAAIAKDKSKIYRVLHHTRGLVLGELAYSEPNTEIARKWMLKSEYEFQYCMAAKERDVYGHSGLASLYLGWSRRANLSVDESTEYLQKTESVISDGLKVVSERTSLLIISSQVKDQLGKGPEQLAKLREAVQSDSASEIARYLLGRAYREQGQPAKTIQTLEPIINTEFNNVRVYVEYTRAMLELGEPISKCAATLHQCRIDGELDPAFVGLYGGLLFIEGKYLEAKQVWDRARSQRFSYEEATRRQYKPSQPGAPKKSRRFDGVVASTHPGYVFIRRDAGPDVICKTRFANGKELLRNQRVTYELSFSARGPLAEFIQVA